jgi:hypothetical protein
VAHYSVPIETNDIFIKIPYNVYLCSHCNTLQNKYLGDLNEIYRINHADSTGKTMTELHECVSSIVKNKSSDTNGFIEIGSSLGILADLIIEKMPEIKYTIIEPCFKGKKENKIIHNDFFENVNEKDIHGNFLIMSHVFEHFYNPLEILTKIKKCHFIDHFLLVFPDLEYYLKNNIYHVLNTEHTYYTDNDFLQKTIENTLNFKLEEKIYYKNHSVIFYFKKQNSLLLNEMPINSEYTNVHQYYSEIIKKVEQYNEIIEKNKESNIYLFPASIHSLFLTTFGLSNLFTGYVDNSPNKIGKKMYGTEKQIYNFMDIVANNKPNTILFLNGGVFNEEITDLIEKSKNISFYC